MTSRESTTIDTDDHVKPSVTIDEFESLVFHQISCGCGSKKSFIGSKSLIMEVVLSTI